MLQSALRHATRARVLGGTGLLGLSLTLARRGKPTASAGQDDAALGSLWGEALDGMIRVPGAEGLAAPNSVLYMAPTTAAAGASRPIGLCAVRLKTGPFSKGGGQRRAAAVVVGAM